MDQYTDYVNNKSWVLLIAGPDWIGKWYISDKIYQTFWIKSIPMVTTRPTRDCDSKKSLSLVDFKGLEKSNRLFWVHRNDNWYMYAYEKDVILKENKIIVIEINPVYQKYQDFTQDLSLLWLNIIDFFWIVWDAAYITYNIKSRTPTISNSELSTKILMWEKITQELKNLYNNQLVKIFPVSFVNRNTISSSVLQEIYNCIS